LKRGEDEALAIFNRRFYSFYCSMPLDIQPLAARMCYVTTLHPDFSLILLEMRSITLHQMLIHAQYVEDNLKSSGKFSDQLKDEEWNADIVDSEHEHEGCHEKELAEHPIEEQYVVSNFVIYYLQEDFCLPVYDEYNNYDEDDFQKTLEIYFHPKNDSFQWSYERIHPIYESYDLYHRENCDLVGGKSFPLCFSSFKILKEKIEFSYRAERVQLQNHTSFLEHKYDIISQQKPFHVISDPMVLYMKNFIEVEMHDKENNHIVAIFSENDIAFENLEQEKSAFEEKDTMNKKTCMLLYICEHEGTIDIVCPFFFIDQQVVFTHILC
jgi:hypothetical protein